MKVYFLLFALLFTQALFAQRSGTLSGKIVDSEQKALEKATVSIMNPADSTLISYTMADEKGGFTLYKLPVSTSLRLIVSFAGMETYEQDVTLSGEGTEELQPIVLLPRELNAVVIEAQAPVRYNGDSLEYNASFFKTLPNATVEDLLKKLPGLQVNMDGTILYQGKEVSKVLVNKKEFFIQDLRIATRNLDADMVQTVQVYRDRGESKRKVDDESELPVTINLKFKKELAKADFGKFYGSGGTNDRYESGILLNAFRDTLQVSFIGYGNNINKQSFDYSELSQYGGLARAENYGFNNFGGQNYQGIQNDMSGGLNVNYDWGDRTKLNMLYQYTFGDVQQESLFENETFYEQETQIGKGGNSSASKNHKNSLSGKFEHRFDTTAHLRFRPSLHFNRSTRNGQYASSRFGPSGPINQNSNSTDGNSSDFNFRHDFYIEKAFNKKWIISLNNTLDYRNDDNFEFENQSNVIYQENEEPVIRLTDERKDGSDLNASFRGNIQYIVSEKVNFDVFGDLKFSQHEAGEEIAQGSESGNMMPRNDSENEFALASRDVITGTRFSWTIAKGYSVQTGIAVNVKKNGFDYRGVIPDRDDRQLYWLPSLSIQLKSLRLNYSRSVRLPQDHAIRVVDNTLNYMGVLRAFPFATNILVDDMNFNFSKYSDNYRTQLYTYGSVSRQSYSLGYSYNRDLSTGRYEGDTYIAPAAINMNLGINYSRQFNISKDWMLRSRQNLHSYMYENYRTENGIANKSSDLSATLDNELTFSWKNLIALSPKYSYSHRWNFNTVDDPNFQNRTSSSHSFTAGLSVTSVKNFTLETSYNRVMQNASFGDDVNMNLVNMSLYYDMKKKGQLKFSVFDLLNQNASIYFSSYNNSNNFYQQNTLKQYFLLGYIYKFNRTQMK